VKRTMSKVAPRSVTEATAVPSARRRRPLRARLSASDRPGRVVPAATPSCPRVSFMKSASEGAGWAVAGVAAWGAAGACARAVPPPANPFPRDATTAAPRATANLKRTAPPAMEQHPPINFSPETPLKTPVRINVDDLSYTYLIHVTPAVNRGCGD